MRLSVIGCGYLGAVHAAAMTELGHDVVGVDVDPAKVAALAEGRAPFHEPGLPELLERGVASGRLRFTTDVAEAAEARVHFLAVGTPQRPDGDGADLRFVDAAVEAIAPHLAPGSLLVGKSTVPVGTAARIAARLAEVAPDASLAWNPEFLREGLAVRDTLEPDRIVYGVPDPTDVRVESDVALLDEVYATPLATGTPRLVADYATAELVKVAANSFLATKISFINAMAEIAEATGADVTLLADAIGLDARIGRKFLNAGIGFGGGCLPKDIRAFAARAEELGVGVAVEFLRDIDAINLRRRERATSIVAEALGDRLAGAKIAVLGVAFKPDSDDIRDSPALDVSLRLRELGARVVATDPAAIPNARQRYPELEYADDADDAIRDAEAIVLVTEWAQYRALDPGRTSALASGRLIVDGRNVLDPVAWRAAGWTYRGMGRP